MKKLFRVFIVFVLCVCFMMPSVAFAAPEETTYNSVQEYVEATQTDAENTSSSKQFKIKFSKFVNGLSNFVINDFLGTVLKLAIPDSAAVADYEKFNIDEYEETEEKKQGGLSAKEYKKKMEQEKEELNKKLEDMVKEYNELADRYNKLIDDKAELERKNRERAQEVMYQQEHSR